jgi:hypothetical protein
MQTKEDFYKMGVQLAVDELLKEGANLAKYVKPGMKGTKLPPIKNFEPWLGDVKREVDIGLALKRTKPNVRKSQVKGLVDKEWEARRRFDRDAKK